MDEVELINSIDLLISDIKSCIRTAGVTNDSSEFQIVTEIFLYKFLNDKFKYESKKINSELRHSDNYDEAFDKLTDKEYLSLTKKLDPNTAVINRKQTIYYLYKRKDDIQFEDGNDFAWLFDKTLEDIANANVDIFSVSTEGNDKIRLFDGVCKNVIDAKKRNGFAKSVICKLVDSTNFEEVFNEKYDFFSTIFEHLISEYNSNGGGVNAEYYTPKSIAQIIGKILVDEKIQNVEVYDPTAGSGTLLMAIAHEIGEDNCSIFSQDLTQKSVKLLRLNLILNNLTHSLSNVKQADILLSPKFLNNEKTDLREFDYIVSNPPFKVDFSDVRDDCLNDEHIKKNGHKRFWAGVPNVKEVDKKGMAIYLLVIQHIIYSLKDNGKAGIVVPTKFLDWKDKIAKEIRMFLVDNKYLRAVVSMPSNVFANTGTSVSVLFIDKKTIHDEVLLLDASSLGKKQSLIINEKKVKKTILSEDDEKFIINLVNKKKKEDGFSVVKKTKDIAKNNYSLVAGQYFEIELDTLNVDKKTFKSNMKKYNEELKQLFDKSSEYEKKIINDFGKY